MRAGSSCNGYWEIDVAVAGTYRFELRRWPKEEDRPISADIDGELKSYGDIKEGYGGGAALDIIRGRLKVSDFEAETDVTGGDKGVTFTTDLNAGETEIQTWFDLKHGSSIGAYYVYIDRE